MPVGAALLASAEGYTPRATQLIEAARERLGTVQEVAGALAENLPQPKLTSGRSRRRKRRKRKKSQAHRPVASGQAQEPDEPKDAPEEPAKASKRKGPRSPSPPSGFSPALSYTRP